MEGIEKTGVNLELASTPERPYGGDYRVGDIVTVNTGDRDESITAPLAGVTISQDGQGGRQVVPSVDTIETANAKQAKKLMGMDKRLGDLEKR